MSKKCYFALAAKLPGSSPALVGTQVPAQQLSWALGAAAFQQGWLTLLPKDVLESGLSRSLERPLLQAWQHLHEQYS